jgi:phosphate transport system permease protein
MNAIETAVLKAHRNEKAARFFITVCGIGMALVPFLIGGFLLIKGIDTFTLFGHSLGEFLFSGQWDPSDTAEGGGSVGAGIYISGSLVTCALALLITLPLSIATAIFMTEIAKPRTRRLIQPAIELFTGIPSVVYGWIGMTVLIPFLRLFFPMPFGFFRIGSRYCIGCYDLSDYHDHGCRCDECRTETMAGGILWIRGNAVGNHCSRCTAGC